MISKLNFNKSKELPKLASVFLDQVFMSVTTLLTSIVLARTYEKLDYADLILLFSIALFVLGFQSSIISKPYAINQNDFNGENCKNYFQFNLNLKLIFTLGIIIIFPILYYFSFETLDFRRFIFFSLYIVAYTFYFFIRETLLSERKTTENLKYGAVCSISLITLLLFILFQNNKDIIFFLLGASVIYILISLFYLVLNFKLLKNTRKHYLRFWNTNWKVGKWLLGSNFLFYLSTNIYPWLLLYITTKNDIAIFGVLMSVSGLMNPILTALSSYLLPLFVKVNFNYHNIKGMVKKWNFVFGGMAVLLIITGYFFGQKIIVLFFSLKYSNLGILAIYPFLIQAINVMFQPFKIALNAIKRTDIEFWILIPRSIISLTLGYVLIRQFGIVGVFYTMIVENITYQLLYFIIYQQIINKKPL